MARSLVPLLILAVSAGCRSIWHDVRFLPSPLEVGVTAAGEPRAEARALLSVRGVRRAVEERPAEVELQFRLENVGDVPLALDPQGFDLVTADLISFRPPAIDPPAELQVAPGAQQLWTLRFATPEGLTSDHLDWSGLNLRFRVVFGERAVITGVTFDGILPAPYHFYDPWWGPYPHHSRMHVGVGVGVSG